MLFKIYQNQSQDPYENLSIEEFLLTCFKPDENILFFFVNDPCVILGRFQNPWKECRPLFLKKRNVALLRRISGGGAVYHDNGNLNFSIITRRKHFSRDDYIRRIQQGLSCLGITTRYENKNSITINGFKISGSAFRYMKTRVLHHGTILVHSHLQLLNQCLIPALKNGTCRGGTVSTRYNVTNINTIVPGITMKKIMHILAEHITQQKDIYMENIREKADWGKIQILVHKNKSFEWVYGQTPHSEITLALDIKKCHTKCIIILAQGRIQKIEVPGFSLLSEKVTQQVGELPFISSVLIKRLKTIQSKGKEKNIILALIEEMYTLDL